MTKIHSCEAFYICSKYGKVVVFDYQTEQKESKTSNDFAALSEKFIADVKEFGAAIPFPSAIIDNLDAAELDEVMMDVEFNVEKAFFISTPATEEYYSASSGEKLKMIGNNGISTAFESLCGKRIEICKSSEAPALFCKIPRSCAAFRG